MDQAEVELAVVASPRPMVEEVASPRAMLVVRPPRTRAVDHLQRAKAVPSRRSTAVRVIAVAIPGILQRSVGTRRTCATRASSQDTARPIVPIGRSIRWEDQARSTHN